jgi:hypothetical protein
LLEPGDNAENFMPVTILQYFQLVFEEVVLV